MKQLTCEMCGSTDLMKSGGVFVCQTCGTKYSVEEAKKLMIEGTVDVSGSTIKVDNTASVQNYLANARRAKEKTDWEDAEKYYNLVEQNDPENIEAVFYSAYAKAMLSLVEADAVKRKQKFEVFGKSISIIDDHYNIEKANELKPIIQQMSADLIRLSNTRGTRDTSDKAKYARTDSQLCTDVEQLFIESLENINQKDEQFYLGELLVVHYRRCLVNSDIFASRKNIYREKLAVLIPRLKELNPSYNVTMDEIAEEEKENKKSNIVAGIIAAIIAMLVMFFFGGF